MSHAMPSPYPAPGEVIDGKYQIERILGEGGMGCVARAFHMLLRAPVALKFMNPQFMTFPGAVERFINEGIASKKIRSDHVVPVDDVGKLASGAPYLVMPCLEGMDLADLLARDGTPGLPVERAVHFTVQILRGLQAAHAAQIIHRDMKPSNCFVVRHDGEDDFVRILDFGISKVVQPGQSASLTQTNSALGTPLYMSPEQARSPRDVDGRSDLYSVGVILYELLTGHTPFFSESGEFTEILFKLFTAEPPPVQQTRPDLPDAFAAVVHKALAREPNDRYASAQEMALALEPWCGERTRPVLTRIKTFKASEAMSMPPPADMPLPPSIVAFSALDAKPQTDVMAHRPTTDVMKGPPVTEILPHAPGRVAAAPIAAEVRARPEEAGARTQFDSAHDYSPHPSGHPRAAAPITGGPVPQVQTGAGPAGTDVQVARAVVPGAQTDLGASRDATPAPSVRETKRSPLVWALPVVALLVGGGAVFALAGMKSNASKGNDGITKTAEPPPAVSSVLPTNAPPTSATTPTASASSTSSAAPSASHAPSATTNVATPQKPPPKPPGPPGPPGPNTHPTSVLDTTIHQ